MFLTPLQIFIGDMHGLNTLEHQPQKIAAMEGVWHTEKGAPLLLFAIPDEQEKTNWALWGWGGGGFSPPPPPAKKCMLKTFL